MGLRLIKSNDNKPGALTRFSPGSVLGALVRAPAAAGGCLQQPYMTQEKPELFHADLTPWLRARLTNGANREAPGLC